MRLGMILYQLGALGILLSAGVFWEEPLAGSLAQNPASWASVLILYGFVVAAGFFLVFVRVSWLEQNKRSLMYVSHGAALLSVFWLLLWCFVWLAIVSTKGEQAEMIIKHMAYLHLFGVSFSMAGYATGWMTSQMGERSARFLMTLSWAVSYMAWFNLYLQPSLRWLWAPAIGGLVAALGAFLVSRSLKPKVETPA
jgi:hypothetical protein